MQPLAPLGESPNIPSVPFLNPSHGLAVRICSAVLVAVKGEDADIHCVPVKHVVF